MLSVSYHCQFFQEYTLNESMIFFEKLYVSWHALDTIKKLKEMHGYVKIILDKLPGVRVDLVRLDGNWWEWELPELSESLKNRLIRSQGFSIQIKTQSKTIFIILKKIESIAESVPISQFIRGYTKMIQAKNWSSLRMVRT